MVFLQRMRNSPRRARKPGWCLSARRRRPSAPWRLRIMPSRSWSGPACQLFRAITAVSRRRRFSIARPTRSAIRFSSRRRQAAAWVGYVGAGTVDLIAEGSGGWGRGGFGFMKMNPRLQVEHPVTEAVTGLDLVEWQLRIAAGEALPLRQSEVSLAGHAVEARIYAEDPARHFLPSSGRITVFEPPSGEGIRVDAGVASGDAVPPDYDPMIAKLIVHAPTRNGALARLAAALHDFVIAGPRVNTPFLKMLAEHPEFRAGRFDTGFIDRHLAELLHTDPRQEAQAIADAVALLIDRERWRIAEVESARKSPSLAAWRDPRSADASFSLGPPPMTP